MTFHQATDTSQTFCAAAAASRGERERLARVRARTHTHTLEQTGRGRFGSRRECAVRHIVMLDESRLD